MLPPLADMRWGVIITSRYAAALKTGRADPTVLRFAEFRPPVDLRLF